MTPAEVEALLKKTQAVSLPVYLLDHSGVSIRTTPFGDMLDSGRIGVIFATKERVVETFCDFSAESIAKAKATLQAEIETYDKYLRGEVYFYEILDGEETLDSCGGMYESEEALLTLCRSTVDNHIADITTGGDLTAFTGEQMAAVKTVQFTYLDLSTAHLTDRDAELLTEGQGDTMFPRTIWKEYGLWLSVSAEPDIFAEDLNYMREKGVSRNLLRAFCAAHKIGAFWINFDQDAAIIEEILINKEETPDE